jgi:hypothetical protein
MLPVLVKQKGVVVYPLYRYHEKTPFAETKGAVGK